MDQIFFHLSVDDLHVFGSVNISIFVKVRSQSTDAHFFKFSAEVSEELNPELAVMHVVQPHLPLHLLAHQLPAAVPVTPPAPPLILVSPGVPHPHQGHPLLPLLLSDADSVETSDGIGVTFNPMILL